jgi:hypothetical protein
MLNYDLLRLNSKEKLMKCIVCGKTQSDFEKMNEKLNESIDTVVEIIEAKRKSLRGKIQAEYGSETKDASHIGNEIGKLNQELKKLKDKTKYFRKVSFTDIEFSYEYLQKTFFEDLLKKEKEINKIINQYINEEDLIHEELKICMRCKVIIDTIIKYKVDNIGFDIDSILEIIYENIKESFGISDNEEY